MLCTYNKVNFHWPNKIKMNPFESDVFQVQQQTFCIFFGVFSKYGPDYKMPFNFKQWPFITDHHHNEINSVKRFYWTLLEYLRTLTLKNDHFSIVDQISRVIIRYHSLWSWQTNSISNKFVRIELLHFKTNA